MTIPPSLSTLLRALADGKSLQTTSRSNPGSWRDVGPMTALRFLVEDWQDGKELGEWWRVKDG